MPFIDVNTSSGHAKFYYTVSTPTKSDAAITDLVEGLPTLLFLHAIYIGQESFQLQFGDPLVRQFNCVVFDQRDHGRTTNDKIPLGYGAKEAAEDFAAFMNALHLPPCHVVAISMGSIGGLRLAMDNPDRVLSLLLISALCGEEPQEIAEGRKEILKYWAHGFEADGSPDESVQQDACYGGLQLYFSNEMDSLASALYDRAFAISANTWGKDNLDGFERITVDFFNNRKAYSTEELGRVKCPVNLIYCSDDVAYPLEYTEQLEADLGEAGVTVKITKTAGPHAGNVSAKGSRGINRAIAAFIAANTSGVLPPPPETVTSPWERDLVVAGWVKDEDSGSDSDSDE